MDHSAMLTVVLAITVGGVLPPTSAQQPSGVCSELEIGMYVTALPDGSSCILAAAGSLRDPTMLPPQQLDENLDLFCTAACGGALAEYYTLACNNIPLAAGFFSAVCQPEQNTSTLGDRCRYSYPDLINSSVLVNLAACAPFIANSSFCPVGCQVALETITDQTGCCYQEVYNNTDVLNSFVVTGLVDSQLSDLLMTLSDPELLSVCSVESPSACTGEPFPGTSPLVNGICTETNVNAFYEDITAECRETVELLENPSNQLSDENSALLCTDNCGMRVADYFNSTCRDSFRSLTIALGCLQSDGMLGSRCQPVLVESVVTPVIAAALSCFAFNTQSQSCPAGCAGGLEGIRNQVGCCYQSIFNNTQYLEGIVSEGVITADQSLIFALLAQEALWNACEVQIPGECVGDPFSAAVTTTAGATKFAASSLVILVHLAVLYYIAW